MLEYNWINELYHCESRNSDEELMHWKYIDKFKRNGRWVYIYKDGSTTGSPLGVKEVGSSMMTLTNRGTTQYGTAGKGVSSSSYQHKPSDRKYSYSSTITTKPGVTGNPQVSKTVYTSSREKKMREYVDRGRKYVADFLRNLADDID